MPNLHLYFYLIAIKVYFIFLEIKDIIYENTLNTKTISFSVYELYENQLIFLEKMNINAQNSSYFIGPSWGDSSSLCAIYTYGWFA